MRLLDAIWKPFVSGEELASRPNYGRVTDMYEWSCCGKFWECNLELPAIPVPLGTEAEEKLMPYIRRTLAVMLYSSFTGDDSKVNPEERIFKADPNMRVFLQSPTALWCRMHDHLLPLLERYTISEMLDFLDNPGDDIMADTVKLVRLMAAGGIEQPVVEASGSDEGLAETAKKVVHEVHSGCLPRQRFLKSYQIRSKKVIPGSTISNGRDGKTTRLDNFASYVDLYPYLFEPITGGDGYTRLDFDVERFNTLADRHGRVAIGEMSSYPIVFEVKKELGEAAFHAPGVDPLDDELPGEPARTLSAADTRGDTDAGKFIDIVNLGALEAYSAGRADRRQLQVQRYIQRLRQAGYSDPRFPGMTCLDIPYVRKFCLPGRRYARGLSLQNLTKEARSVACGTAPVSSGAPFCYDVDFKNCVPTVCRLLAEKFRVEENTPTLIRFVSHPDAWKSWFADYYGILQEEAKNKIVAVFFGQMPRDDNPMLWGLAQDVATLRSCVLSSPEYAHLNGCFNQRARPILSRWAYAVFAVEDELLSKLMGHLHRELPNSHPSTLLFDGFVLVSREPVADFTERLESAMQTFGRSEKIQARVKPWPVASAAL